MAHTAKRCIVSHRNPHLKCGLEKTRISVIRVIVGLMVSFIRFLKVKIEKGRKWDLKLHVNDVTAATTSHKTFCISMFSCSHQCDVCARVHKVLHSIFSKELDPFSIKPSTVFCQPRTSFENQWKSTRTAAVWNNGSYMKVCFSRSPPPIFPLCVACRETLVFYIHDTYLC